MAPQRSCSSLGDQVREPKMLQRSSVNDSQVQDDNKQQGKDGIKYPTGIKLVLTMGLFSLPIFLVALDRLIVSAAIPAITDEFHSVSEVGWYGGAYLLTSCTFTLLFGKIYSLFHVKNTFIGMTIVFLAGSTICAAAPNSIVFILGRAVAGLGCAGINTGSIVMIVYVVPLHKRPLYIALLSVMYTVSSVTGPLIGGAFTSGLSWRWCFYINLPIGGVALGAIGFIVRTPPPPVVTDGFWAKILQLDILGNLAFVPATVCLLLALQWGGTQYAWDSGLIIALLAISGILAMAFVLVQILRPDTATVTPRVFRQRSIYAGFFASICTAASQITFVYYLPMWFQVILGVSAIDSGIRILPFVSALAISGVIAGGLVNRIGYYLLPMYFGIVPMCVGAGLLTTLRVHMSQARWIGYQFLCGFGFGCVVQSPQLAAQIVLPMADVSIGTALMWFGQNLGGVVVLAIDQTILTKTLVNIITTTLPGFNTTALGSSGVTAIVNMEPGERPAVLLAYNKSLRAVFRVGLTMSCLQFLGAVGMEWRSIKERKNKVTEHGEESHDQPEKDGKADKTHIERSSRANTLVDE